MVTTSRVARQHLCFAYLDSDAVDEPLIVQLSAGSDLKEGEIVSLGAAAEACHPVRRGRARLPPAAPGRATGAAGGRAGLGAGSTLSLAKPRVGYLGTLDVTVYIRR